MQVPFFFVREDLLVVECEVLPRVKERTDESMNTTFWEIFVAVFLFVWLFLCHLNTKVAHSSFDNQLHVTV